MFDSPFASPPFPAVAWNFLEPVGLAGLAALLPIIALYFLKLKREERVVPSTLLWKKVIKDLHVNAPFQRLKYSLLLLLQLLLVALMAFALARPFLSVAADTGKYVVLLVDTSASMATKDAGGSTGKTRLEKAIEDARQKIDDMSRVDEMQIVAFDEDVRQVCPWTNDRSYLKKVVSELEPRHLRTHAQEAFETALAMAEERKGSEVLVLSDGCFDRLSLNKLLGESVQGTNTEEASLARLRKFRFVKYGREYTDNVGITGINARTRLVRQAGEGGARVDTLETQMFVVLENFGLDDVKAILTLTSDAGVFAPVIKVVELKGRQRGLESLDGNADGSTLESARSSEAFKLPANFQGVVTAAVRTEAGADNFPLDDRAQIVVGGAEGMNVLLVTGVNYFIEKVLVVMRGVKVDKMTPEEFEKDWNQRGALSVAEYDAVIFDGCAPPRWDDGGAIFLGTLPPLPGFKYRDPKAPKGAEAAPPSEPVLLEWPRVIDWDVAHPAMRYVNFGNVQIKQAQAWDLPKTAAVLVETSGGPLIAALESDRVNAVGTSFQVLDSDWPYRPSLPLFLRNSVAWVSEVSPRRRPTALKTGEVLSLPPVEGASTATLTWPDGHSEQVELSATRKMPVKGVNSIGLYRLTGIPGDGPDGRTFAVNLADTKESDNLAQASLQVGEETVEASPSAIEGKREIWRTLALIAVGLLMAEWFLYHRRLGL
ncbi:MAG: BatA and WFA domain-containing protein [Planctomycetota bacterium]|nr:BatA and WFA domain-containing protein [Planctomycetota bacterium]